MSWRYSLNQLLWEALDWIFPPVCGGCGRYGFRFCPQCRQEIQALPAPLCRICGLPISRPGTCPACKASRPPYQQLRSWSIFEGPIRQGLHDLKYRNNLVLGDVFGKLMADYALSLGWPVERVVPVPVSKARWMERGYNQAAEIALPLAALCAWPYDPSALVRVRESRSQVGLSADERKENVRDAFRGEPARLNGKRILVLDDVSTTGATLRSAAEACLKAGAREVYALTLARALPRHGLESV